MASFPRSRTLVSASGLNSSLGRVNRSDLAPAISGEVLQGVGTELYAKGQRILQREGETLAIEQFADFQRSEMLRFNEEKLSSVNNPDGFTERFMEQSKKNFDELSGQVSNKFYTKTMNSRFAGLTNSFIQATTSFEGRQKIANRKARYMSAVGSYSSTVYEDPSQLSSIINLAKGDATAASNSGVFGSEGIDIANKSAKKIATSAIMGTINQAPQNLGAYMEKNNLKGLYSGKEINKFEKLARTKFANAPKIELMRKQMGLVSRKNEVMELYIEGELSLGAIDNMSELSDEDKDIAKTLIVGGVKNGKADPSVLADLLARRGDLLDKETSEISTGDGLKKLLNLQNDIYKAIGKDINTTEAKSLLKGTVDGVNGALDGKIDRNRTWGEFFSGERTLYPEEMAIMSINEFAKNKDPREKRELLRAISGKFDAMDLDAFDNNEIDADGQTEKDKQINYAIQSELGKSIKGLQSKSGSVNRVLGSDGADSVINKGKATTKADTSIVPDTPKTSFKTIKEAEASGVKGLVMIGGRRARID